MALMWFSVVYVWSLMISFDSFAFINAHSLPTSLIIILMMMMMVCFSLFFLSALVNWLHVVLYRSVIHHGRELSGGFSSDPCSSSGHCTVLYMHALCCPPWRTVMNLLGHRPHVSCCPFSIFSLNCTVCTPWKWWSIMVMRSLPAHDYFEVGLDP